MQDQPETYLITMVPFFEVTNEFHLRDLENLIVNHLQLPPMWPPLLCQLKAQNVVGMDSDQQHESVSAWHILQESNSTAYLQMCPTVSSLEDVKWV